MKSKVVYVCSECGYESAKWIGKCPGCGGWNTFAEDVVVTSKSSKKVAQSFSCLLYTSRVSTMNRYQRFSPPSDWKRGSSPAL